MDLIDMENMSDGKYKWILYIRDRFAKCSCAYPLESDQMELLEEKILQQYYFFAISRMFHSVHEKGLVPQIVKVLHISTNILLVFQNRIFERFHLY